MSSVRLLPLLASLLLPTSTLAQEAPSTAAPPAVLPAAAPAAPAPAGNRERGGHLFQPVLGITSAFATTNFGTFLTAGYGSTQGRITLTLPTNPPTDPPTTQTFEGSVDYAAIGGALDFSLQFLDHFAVRVLLNETIYTGTTGAAAAVVGTNALLGVGLGLTASFPVGDSLQLAAVVEATSAPRLGLLLGPALKDAYDNCSTGVANCSVDLSKLFDQQNVTQLKPGVAAAWSPWAPLGVTADLSWVQTRLEQKGAATTSAGAVEGGLGLDFDFHNVSSVPIGLQASFSTLVPVSGDPTSRYTDVGGGLLYTGRKDLSAGLQLVVRRFKVVPEVDVSWSTVLVLTGLRYYW